MCQEGMCGAPWLEYRAGGRNSRVLKAERAGSSWRILELELQVVSCEDHLGFLCRKVRDLKYACKKFAWLQDKLVNANRVDSILDSPYSSRFVLASLC